MAYQQVVDQLKNQPGGADYAANGGTNPLLGSLTILPLLLFNNPGRPDGGAFARFGALAKLFGIETVNPHTQVSGSGGPLGASRYSGFTPAARTSFRSWSMSPSSINRSPTSRPGPIPSPC